MRISDWSSDVCSSDLELQQAVRQLGGKPKEIGTFAHTVHRTLMHLRVTALGRDENSLLEEDEGEENEVEGRLAKAIAVDTPPKILELLELQYRKYQGHAGSIRAGKRRYNIPEQ